MPTPPFAVPVGPARPVGPAVPVGRATLGARAALLGALWLGAALLPRGAAAATDPKAVLQAAEEGRKVDNSAQKVRMVLISKSGAERVREFELKVRRDGDVLRSYTRFLSPADVAGTQLVVVDQPDTRDEQLLFLPALRRTNRIAGKARTGSFMGSDFAFEDLEVSSTGDATHSLVTEDDAQWVIDTVPGAESSYGRLRTTVRRSDKLPVKVEFFDKKGAPLKTLEVTEVMRQGETTFPKVSVMTHLQAGTRTRLEVLESRQNLPPAELPDELFTASWMERHP